MAEGKQPALASVHGFSMRKARGSARPPWAMGVCDPDHSGVGPFAPVAALPTPRRSSTLTSTACWCATGRRRTASSPTCGTRGVWHLLRPSRMPRAAHPCRPCAARVREGFAASRDAPDAEIVEELSRHAAAACKAAGEEGCSHEDARGSVDALIMAWRGEASGFRGRPRNAAMVATQ